MQGGSSFTGDLDLWQAWLERHQAESLPVPKPKRLPPWWKNKAVASLTVKWVE